MKQNGIDPSVVSILKLSGILFAIIGVYCFFMPQVLIDLMGLDEWTAKVLAGSLAFVGISDFIVAQIFLSRKK